MGHSRASNFSHGLACVLEEAPSQDYMAEEAPSQDNIAAAAEQRRQHILESMAKLEGHSRTSARLSSPTQSIIGSFQSTKSQVNPSPISQQVEPFPYRQSFTGYAAAPLMVPCLYYYPVYPANLMPMPSHFIERNSMSFDPSLTSGTPHVKHLSAPIYNEGTRSQELRTRNMRQENSSNANHMYRRQSQHSNNMKTPEKSQRSRSFVTSPESSPESQLSTPPPVPKTRSIYHQSNQVKAYPKLQFSETHQHSQYQEQIKSKHNAKIQPVNQRTLTEKNKYENLISSNNYALQLESKKTGIKLIEKKRLTFDEVNVLKTLPPLPPRPDTQRSSLSTHPKKEKKDPFAWFRY